MLTDERAAVLVGRIAVLEAALRPFAEAPGVVSDVPDTIRVRVPLEWCRAARRALDGEQTDAP